MGVSVSKNYILCGSIAVVLSITFFIVLWKRKKDEKFVSIATEEGLKMNYKPGFLPSHQGPYFQGMPPSLKVENDYHTNMLNNCQGDYGNFECRQKSYLKAMKAGTTDRADLICYKYRHNEDDYYRCLDGVYGNYLWSDRYVGTDRACDCPDGMNGTLTTDELGNLDCFCPDPRPLHDREPVDHNNELVDRVLQ